MRRLAAVLLLLAPVLGTSPVAARVLPDPLAPAATGGLEAVDRALAELATHRRLLVVGAHPDDEDTALLAWVSRALGGEAAYLSLSRGEGGQNLIGPELGEDLGLLRSEELLAARRIDGARQFFTRAHDFGYTRSLVETFREWPREELLRDALRVVRRFKPQVMVSIFPPDESAGHGQHHAAGVVAHEVWELARRDDAGFGLEQQEGLHPWAPQALYRSAWRDPTEATLELPLAALEPLSGRSVVQLAAASRSMHRSQDMGRAQPLGPASRPLAWVAGGAGPGGSDPFAGIDTSLAAIAATLPPGTPREELAALLADVEQRAGEARAALSPLALPAAVDALAALVARLVEARDLAAAAGPEALAAPVRELVAEKLATAEAGLAAAAGIAFDARADRERVVPGQPLAVTIELWNAGAGEVTIAAVELAAAPGWQPPAVAVATPILAPGEIARLESEWTVGDAAPTVPYFLARPRAGNLYDWSAAAPAERGEPFEAPPLVARVALTVHGQPVELEREVVHVYADQARGEVRRPLRVVPAVEVTVEPQLVLWPLAAPAPRELAITVASNLARTVHGALEVALGDAPLRAIPFTLAADAGAQTVPLVLAPPLEPVAGGFTVEVTAEPLAGAPSRSAFPLVDHAHVRPRPRPRAATARVRLLDLALPDLERIAYVPGASDRVPEVLTQLGLPLERLSGAALATARLADYDAVIVGSRAYETEPELARANGRLLDYAAGGGLVLVQYQQYGWTEAGLAPFGLTIGRPHGRVTDEASPVRPLAPEHPVFRRPNPLGAADWEGWVQERGLYFAASWEAPFEPLLALQDPEQPEELGGLLVAPVGEGTYVYTGLAFFRQLPAGVPGALRLFANLLALAEPAEGAEAAP